MIETIKKLMEHHTAGDPISGLKWTYKTTDKISTELRKGGLDVSPKTVARLLKGLKFSLRVNHLLASPAHTATSSSSTSAEPGGASQPRVGPRLASTQRRSK
ncbi:MAG: hypothetical protein JXO72_11470 [Vicinamibacteria bacterium]|nr:hypothetical protein [Vicinamibacteria bacterium]